MPIDDAARPGERICALVFFTVASFVVFSANLGDFFLSDDFGLLAAVNDGGPFGVWTRGPGFFRPIVSLSLWLDLQLYGLRPAGFHLTNTLLHGLNAFLVAEIALVLFDTLPRPLRRATAAFSGALFLLLLSHGEAVIWISGRVDLLCTFFGLASFRALLAAEARRRLAPLALALALFLLALGCKEAAAPWPLIVFAHTLSRTTRDDRSRFWRFGVPLLFVASLLAYLPLRRALLGVWVGGYGSGVHLRLEPLTMLRNAALFTLRTVGPAWHLEELLGLAALLAAAGWGWRRFGSRPARPGSAADAGARSETSSNRALLFPLAALLLSLLPVLNLSLSERTHEGERFLYLPSAFAALLVTRGLARLLPGRRQLAVAAALVLTLSTGFLLRSSLRWRAASQLATSIVDDLRQIAVGRELTLLALPDSVRGAYVFRNGLREARRLFVDGGWGVRVVSHYRSVSGRETLQLRGTGDRYRLVLEGSRDARFFNANGRSGGPLVMPTGKTLAWQPQLFVFELSPRRIGEVRALVSAGRLQRVR